MNITSIQPNMVAMVDRSMFHDGDRLFYELGYKRDWRLKYGENWIRTGQFKEIENPIQFVRADHSLGDIGYLKHHNFMLIKK